MSDDLRENGGVNERPQHYGQGDCVERFASHGLFERPAGQRGRVIGITAMGNNFGGFVMPPLLGFILPVLMWQGTYAVLAFMSGALVL